MYNVFSDHSRIYGELETQLVSMASRIIKHPSCQKALRLEW